MEVTGVRAAWRFCTKAPGAPCVMMTGTPMMPTWSAGSWAVAGPFQPQQMPGLVRAQDRSSWTMCAAQDMSPTYGAVPTEVGSLITVVTMRMLASSAQVGLQITQPPSGVGSTHRRQASPPRTSTWSLSYASCGSHFPRSAGGSGAMSGHLRGQTTWPAPSRMLPNMPQCWFGGKSGTIVNTRSSILRAETISPFFRYRIMHSLQPPI